MWKPVNQQHAIDSVILTVAFAEPVPSLAVRRATKAFEKTAYQEDFGHPQPVQAIGFAIGPDGMPSQVAPRPSGMVMFQNTSIDKDWSGAVVQKLIDQVQLGPPSFVYQTWRYRRWNDLIAKYTRAMGEAVSQATSAVALQSIRLEYHDRFVFVGEPIDARPHGVIRHESDFVSRKIFEQEGLWHSHIGVLTSEDQGERLLHQVNIDCVDLSGPGDLAGRRSIGIMTGVERRFEIPGKEFSEFSEIVSTFNDLHNGVIDLFKEVVSDEALAKVGLAK